MEFLLTPGELKKKKNCKNVLGKNGKTFHGNPEIFT